MKKAKNTLTMLLALTMALTYTVLPSWAAGSELLLTAGAAIRDSASTAAVEINYGTLDGSPGDASLTGAYWYTVTEAGEDAPTDPQDAGELTAWTTGGFGPDLDTMFLISLSGLDPETEYTLYVVAHSDAEGEDQLSNLEAVDIPPYAEDISVIILVSIAQPAAIAAITNGAAKTETGLGLPDTVTITVADGDGESDTTATVTWDLENCLYDPTFTEEQTFTVNGTVELPYGVENPADISLTVAVEVVVDGFQEGNDDESDDDGDAEDEGDDPDGNPIGSGGGGNDDIQITCTIGSTAYTINSKQHTMAVAPYYNDGSPYLHVRVIGEAIGAAIGWDQDTQTVSLESANIIVKVTVGKTIIEINRDGAVTTESIESAPQNVWPGAVMLPASAIIKIADIYGYTLYINVNAGLSADMDGDVFYVGTQASQWADKPAGRFYKDPQQGIDAAADWSAANGDPQAYVLVAVGTYLPETQGGGKSIKPEDNYFSLRSNITVIGGFKGDESDLTPTYDQNDPAAPDAQKTIFTGNNVRKSVFYHSGAGGTLKNAVIAGGNGGTNGNGGGMYSVDSPVNLENCTFINNSAGNGGGLYIAPGIGPALSNCTFADNTAESNGGGLYYAAPGDPDDPPPLLTDCTFTGNMARVGGGLWSQDALTLNGCIFTNNTAAKEAGGLYCPVTSLNNCAFTFNKAKTGGAIHNGGDSTLNNCIITDNAALENGGGMFNASGNPILTGCLFIANEAVNGGGLYSEAGSPTLVNCTVFKNRAGSGGGLYHNSGATLYNCLVTLNYSDGVYLTSDSDINSGSPNPITIRASVDGGVFYDPTGADAPILPAPALSDFEDSGALKPTAFYAIRQGSYELVAGYLQEDWRDISDALFYSDSTIDLGALRYTGPFVPVSLIEVTGANGLSTITENGGVLQMAAQVQPGDATNKSVAWRITSGASCAEISVSGLLQAADNGTVTVRASARDGSGKYGECTISISGQAYEVPLAEDEAVSVEDVTMSAAMPQDAPSPWVNAATMVSDAKTPLALQYSVASEEVNGDVDGDVDAAAPDSPNSGAIEENEPDPPRQSRLALATGAVICLLLLSGFALNRLRGGRKP